MDEKLSVGTPTPATTYSQLENRIKTLEEQYSSLLKMVKSLMRQVNGTK